MAVRVADKIKQLNDGSFKLLDYEDIDHKPFDSLDPNTFNVDENGVLSVIGGSGSGTNNYTDLIHKPSINSIELNGNKSLSDLSLYSKTEVDDLLDEKSKVIANPTLVGTEDSLEGIQVGDDKFKVNTNIINSGVHIHTTGEEDIESQLASEVHLDQTQDVAVGTIVPFFGITAPAHYLACDGAVYNITAYPDLAEFIKNEFGSYNYFGGDGTTTFGVPDLKGEFLRGTGINSHTEQGSGLAVGSHQDATNHILYGHWHSNNNTSGNIWVQTDYTNSSDGTTLTPENQDYGIIKSGYTNGQYFNLSNTMTGSGQAFYTSRPTNTSVLWCIKAEATHYLVNQIENATIASMDVYSEDEKCIGCWTNGKPIYRKVFTQDTSGTIVWVTNSIIQDLENIVNLHGILKRSSGENDIFPSMTIDGWYETAYYTSNGIIIRTNINLTGSIKMIIEYTKTTDAENSFSIDMLSNVQDLVLTAAEVQTTIDAIEV